MYVNSILVKCDPIHIYADRAFLLKFHALDLYIIRYIKTLEKIISNSISITLTKFRKFPRLFLSAFKLYIKMMLFPQKNKYWLKWLRNV